MKNLLRLEELGQFGLCLTALIMFDVPWWSYLLLALGPDVGMLGYLVSPRLGAITYNLLHHKLIALALVAAAFLLFPRAVVGDAGHLAYYLIVSGIILYGHASMDRIFGYGLKFNDSFHNTHLGWIGKDR